MKSWEIAGAIVAALTATSAMAQVAMHTSICDRNCLTKLLDRYLTAVVAHDPAKAPLALGFRQTENAVAIPQGDGLWQSATGLGPLQRRYFDTVTGTAAYFGTLQLPGNETAVVSLRLHQTGGIIDEAEWHVARASDPGITGEPGKTLFDVPTLLANPPAQRMVPTSERLSRDALMAIANSYFDGITSENAKLIVAHPGCLRLENGAGPPPGTQGDNGAPPDCTSGQGRFGVSLVAGRRFPVVDEEAQVVMVIGTFMRKPGNPKRRNQFSEFFYIDHARIRQVYAAYFYARPDLAVPNWLPYDGHFPLPADFGTAK